MTKERPSFEERYPIGEPGLFPDCSDPWTLKHLLFSVEKDLDVGLIEDLKKPVPHYEEYIREVKKEPGLADNILARSSREAIASLDIIADQYNAELEQGNLDKETFDKYYVPAMTLIYGRWPISI